MLPFLTCNPRIDPTPVIWTFTLYFLQIWLMEDLNSSPKLNNLSAGEYEITIFDELGCFAFDQFTRPQSFHLRNVG